MSVITALLAVVIVSALVGHGALYYTKPKQPPSPPKENLVFVHDPVVRQEYSKTRQQEAIDNPEIQVLKDKVSMAHSRLNNIERNNYASQNPSGELLLLEKIRKLENTSENNKIDLIAIKQILQDIQYKMK